MRLSAFFMPLFTLIFGILGYRLRLSEQHNVFDSATGLPMHGATTTYALFALTALFLLVVFIFILCAVIRNKSSYRFDLAFGTSSLIYVLVSSVIGAAWGVGTYFYFLELNAENMLSAATVAYIVLSALTALAVIALSLEVFRVTHRRTPYYLCIIPIIFMCFWLILIYSENASNPILLSYAYQIVAIVTTALSFYFTACFVYGKIVTGRALLSYFTSIYFCMVTLADGHPTGVNVVLIAIVAYCTVHSFALIRNLKSRIEMSVEDS